MSAQSLTDTVRGAILYDETIQERTSAGGRT